ncbi:DUF885 domain-containing protein [Ruminococcaceae bacterium OttesenSCG-928-N02]|nr:DUF885 domain-containing protein [Ruminococcaceae bacterium OttesenSCG-928-N02]
MKKRLLAILMAMALMFTFVACGGGEDPTPAPTPEGERLHALEEIIFTDYVTSDTDTLHFYFKDPEAAGYTMEEPSVGSLTLEAHNSDIALYQSWLDELYTIDKEALNKNELHLYEVIESYITGNLRFADFYYYADYFNGMSGIHLNIPINLTEFKFYRASDVDDYIAVISLYAELLREGIVFEQEKVELGLSIIDSQIDEVIEQCNTFLSTADNHDLISSFNDRIDALEGLTDEERAAYKEENERALREDLFPVYSEIIDAFTDLRGQAVNHDGIYYYPKGEEYITLTLEDYTMRGMTPQDVYDLLNNSLTRAISRMQEIIHEDPTAYSRSGNLNLSQGSTEADLAFLQENGPKVFPKIPEHTLTVLDYPESFDRSSMMAYYYAPPLDDLTENVVRVNPDRSGEADFLTTLAHETYGGHLLDRVYMRENSSSRLQQVLGFSSRTEGFAEYGSRRLLLASSIEDKNALEMLLLDDEYYRYFEGMLVVGIHGLGWKAEDVSAALTEMGMMADAEYIYQVFLTIPPSYLAYSCGLAIFQDLYYTASAALGNDFNEVEYNTMLLDIGIAPFDIVQARVYSWITAQGGELNNAA